MSGLIRYYEFQICHADYQGHDNYFGVTSGVKYETIRDSNSGALQYSKREQLTARSKAARIFDEQIVARISSFAFGVVYGVEDALSMFSRTVDNIIGGMLTKDFQQIVIGGKNLCACLTHAVSLPLLGIVGIFMPKRACKIALTIHKFSDEYFFGKSKIYYGCYSIRFMSLVKGVTVGLRECAQGLGDLILSPFLEAPLKRIPDDLEQIIFVISLPIRGIYGCISGFPNQKLHLMAI